MKYELCKKLKEAGFPQETRFAWTDGIASPQLSELIEACGDSLMGLSRYRDGERVDGWLAGYLESDVASHISYEKGKTPEEAVANLFLALNK